jgi:hypothetical protein
MTEDDLKNAQELFRKRKSVLAGLQEAGAGVGGDIVDVRITVNRWRRNSSGAREQHNGYVNLDKEDGASMCKMAVTLLTERLKDIDASLLAFGCEPPKDTSVEMAKLRA